jgi:hypothetical protein
MTAEQRYEYSTVIETAPLQDVALYGRAIQAANEEWFDSLINGKAAEGWRLVGPPWYKDGNGASNQATYAWVFTFERPVG